jgi:hypothetical protein
MVHRGVAGSSADYSLVAADGNVIMDNPTGTRQIRFPSTGGVKIDATTASTSTTTGSLINAGGFGNAGRGNFGDSLQVTKSVSSGTFRAQLLQNTSGTGTAQVFQHIKSRSVAGAKAYTFYQGLTDSAGASVGYRAGGLAVSADSGLQTPIALFGGPSGGANMLANFSAYENGDFYKQVAYKGRDSIGDGGASGDPNDVGTIGKSVIVMNPSTGGYYLFMHGVAGRVIYVINYSVHNIFINESTIDISIGDYFTIGCRGELTMMLFDGTQWHPITESNETCGI